MRRKMGCARTGERGVSVLIILTLLACMAILVVANSTALALLKQELKLIDQQQQQKYGQSPGH
jgi:type II secretory pathway component PulK